MSKINIKKIRPMFTAIVTTAAAFEDNTIAGTHLIDTRKTTQMIDNIQRVVAVGSTVRDIKVGDLVCLDFKMYGKVVHNPGSIEEATIKDNPIVEYLFDTIEIDGVDYLYLQDRDVKFIIDEYEEVSSKKGKIDIPDKHFELN